MKKSNRFDERILYAIVVIAVIAFVLIGWAMLAPQGLLCAMAYFTGGRCGFAGGGGVDTSSFNFGVILRPSEGTIGRGGESLWSVVGFYKTSSGSSQVIFPSASGMPTSSSLEFAQPSCTASCSIGILMKTTSGTPPGTYYITITGTTSSGLKRSAVFTLTVI